MGVRDDVLEQLALLARFASSPAVSESELVDVRRGLKARIEWHAVRETVGE